VNSKLVKQDRMKCRSQLWFSVYSADIFVKIISVKLRLKSIVMCLSGIPLVKTEPRDRSCWRLIHSNFIHQSFKTNQAFNHFCTTCPSSGRTTYDNSVRQATMYSGFGKFAIQSVLTNHYPLCGGTCIRGPS